MASQSYMTTTNTLTGYGRRIAIAFALALLFSCGSNPTKEQIGTLADIDNGSSKIVKPKKTKLSKRTDDDVRRAYQKYIDSAKDTDNSRQKALTRLAELELELSNALLKSSDEQEEIAPEYKKSLNRTITLLETTLRDYPNAKGNDKVMYQLAQAYDQVGRYNDAIATLRLLGKRYPKSLYYPEAQFRIAETAFARGDYITAEDAYTEVILTPGSEKFYEKSFFKRGWTRYKQQLYLEALDDYIKAFNQHNFNDVNIKEGSEKTQFDEYIRALGLAFSYQRNEGAIREYFAQKGTFRYLYEIYSSVSDIYLKQERFSDAANILDQFIQQYKLTKNSPLAELKIINAWQEGGFYNNLYDSIERFYVHYNPNADFWKQISDQNLQKEVDTNLRKYIVQVSSYFHENYQSSNKNSDFLSAQNWYNRYLDHYKSYANQDHIYGRYAELLLSNKQEKRAIQYFTLAAYDGEIIIDKRAAYASISLSNALYQKSKNSREKEDWLNQYLSYAQRYVELYPDDERSKNIGQNASALAFEAQFYMQAIEFANYLPDTIDDKSRFNINNIKARSYLEIQAFADAELVFLELLESKKKNKTIRNSLALSIYRQAESSQLENDIDTALKHFIRISDTIPESDLAPKGLYDAIAMMMNNKRWNDAIGIIDQFKKLYPKHELASDVSKTLSVAYLNSDQKVKAAKEFERIANFGEDLEVKRAALWQAAELYESKDNVDGAIRSYRTYAHNYKSPYAQNIEAMFKLSELYKRKRDVQKRYFWQAKIQRDDRKATKRVKTDRTNFIASSTILDLGKQKQNEFEKRKLVEPIAKNLKAKKEAMQEAVKLYGQASTYGIAEITTQATYSIGEIYNNFSVALLDSERPKNLNEDELEQYEILLEDQAFPFEEKAIEFYEANLARTQDGIYDDYVSRSFEQLVELFPVRYQRKGKIDAYIESH